MRVQGEWYPEGSAVRVDAALSSFDGTYTIETESGETFSGELSDLAVSDRLGNVERTLTLKDGSVFCTGDNSGVDLLYKNNKSTNGIIHRLESHFGWVATAFVFTIVFAFAFVKWGIPWAGVAIAHALPQEVNEFIAEGSLSFLDEYLFEESKLESETKEEIRQHFESVLIPLDERNGDITYQIHFREWMIAETSIPNAFALPSGDIILTDKFVELAENQSEIDSVLLHEMGHVVHRHSLEMVAESAIFTTLVLLITGDNSAIVDMGIGIGSLLVSSHYSRGHETEADTYAFERMLVAGIDPQSFGNILDRMTQYMGESETADFDSIDVDSTDDGEEEGDNQEGDKKDDSLLDYLSSHPNTAERLERARRYSECFQSGLRFDCEVN